jgi:hypothetical protein
MIGRRAASARELWRSAYPPCQRPNAPHASLSVKPTVGSNSIVRPLDVRPSIPSPAIRAVATRVQDEARRLANIARGSRDVDLDRLWRRLAMWSASLDHMAFSGPASHDAALRVFEEHPDHARVGEDPMLDYEALADVVGFLSVGDMVMSALASTFMGRWGTTFADDNPWRSFMAEVDIRALRGDAAPVIGAARELDLDLREARHRITAHRRHAHAEILEWDSDDVLTINLTNPALTRIDPAWLEELGLDAADWMPTVADDGTSDPVDEVLALLRSAETRLAEAMDADPRWRIHARPYRAATEATHEIHDLFERLHYRASFLDGDARRLVRNAHQIAGYESVRPGRVVEAALRATGEITAAHAPS